MLQQWLKSWICLDLSTQVKRTWFDWICIFMPTLLLSLPLRFIYFRYLHPQYVQLTLWTHGQLVMKYFGTPNHRQPSQSQYVLRLWICPILVNMVSQQHLGEISSNLQQMSLGPKVELIHFCWSKVKVTVISHVSHSFQYNTFGKAGENFIPGRNVHLADIYESQKRVYKLQLDWLVEV